MPKKHYLLIILLMPLLLWANGSAKTGMSGPGSATHAKTAENKPANDCIRLNNWQLERILD